VFDLDLDVLLPLAEKKVSYTEIPKFPVIERDLALIVDDRVTAGEVMGHLKRYRSDLLEKAELFDYYKGRNIPQDKKSLGIRITYRSKDRTLTDAEVEALHGSLVEHLLSATGGKLRGAD
jgi:phenylalanyl-tRNA synthetase beta chain